MKTVKVDLGDRSYPIYIGAGLLEHGELLRKHIPGKRVLIVTNETIAPLYLDKWVAARAMRGPPFAPPAATPPLAWSAMMLAAGLAPLSTHAPTSTHCTGCARPASQVHQGAD